jgi:hypothetical protein
VLQCVTPPQGLEWRSQIVAAGADLDITFIDARAVNRSHCQSLSSITFESDFVSRLILSGLSTNPITRPSFNEIIEALKDNDFRITEEVDSEAVSAFVSSVESSEL